MQQNASFTLLTIDKNIAITRWLLWLLFTVIWGYTSDLAFPVTSLGSHVLKNLDLLVTYQKIRPEIFAKTFYLICLHELP